MLWYFETLKDHDKPELFPAIFKEDAPQETVDAFIENAKALFNKLEARWADGREHVAGASITAGDYYALAQNTQVVLNTGLKHPSIQAKLAEHWATLPNCQRVINNIKAPLQSTVDALQPTWI